MVRGQPRIHARGVRGALVAVAALAAAGGLALAAGSARGNSVDLPEGRFPGPGPDLRPVGEAEWAARLIEALGLTSALPEDQTADDLFTILCPTESEFSIGYGGTRVRVRPPLRVVADALTAPIGTNPLRVRVSVPASALYVLAVSGKGAQRWSADGHDLGELDPSALGVDWAPTLVPLSRGVHEFAGRLTPGASAHRIELTAFRALCIAPAAGWRADRVLRFGDKARTLVRALGLERELPADGTPLRVEGERFDVARPPDRGARTSRRLSKPASGGVWAVARGGAVELSWRLELDTPGVYSLAARVHGTAREVWQVDGLYGVAIRPEPGATSFAWEPVLTLPLDAGEHVVRVRLARGAGVDVLRLLRRRADDSAYLGVLGSLGLREGAPDAPVDVAAAQRNLTSPAFRTLVAGFLRRFGAPPGDALALVEQAVRREYDRPLSPLLPGSP